jgi:hypothetical protein
MVYLADLQVYLADFARTASGLDGPRVPAARIAALTVVNFYSTAAEA